MWLRGVPRFENLLEFVGEGASAHEVAAFTRTARHADLSWDDLATIRGMWKGPFLIKGVLAAEDATRAIGIGADGIVVSNHGGRQLDGATTTLEALPAIAEAAGDRLTVLMDGGVRRGADVVKALALGAKAVLLGRAPLYGVAAGGEAGAARALEILGEETARVMSLIGCGAVGTLSSRYLSPSARRSDRGEGRGHAGTGLNGRGPPRERRSSVRAIVTVSRSQPMLLTNATGRNQSGRTARRRSSRRAPSRARLR